MLQFNCHCHDCQKSTGAAFAPIMFFTRKDLHVSGELEFYESIGGSGKPIKRGFCKTCGAQVLGDVAIAPALLSIRAGTLDDLNLYQPTADIFTAHAASWDHMDPALKKFEAMPPPPWKVHRHAT